MAPSPAAGKSGAVPKTPTKAGKNPASSATSKLSQTANSAGDKPSDATKSTPSAPARGATDKAKSSAPTASKTSSPKLPPRPKAGEAASDTSKGSSGRSLEDIKKDLGESAPEPTKEAAEKTDDTTKKAEDTAESTADDAGGKIGLEDNDPNEGDDEGPVSKVSQAGNETGGEDESVTTDNLDQAAPEPVDDEDDNDTVGGAKETAEGVTDDAETTEAETPDTDGATGGGVLGGARGLAGKAAGAASNAGKSVGSAAGKAGRGDVSGAAGDVTGGAEDTADDVKDGAEDTADDVKDGAEDTADGAADDVEAAAPEEAGDAVDGVKDTAEDTADDAQDQVEDTAEKAEGAADGVPDAAEDAPDTAEGAVNGVKDTAEDAQDTAEDAADGAKETAEGAADDLPIDLAVLKGLEVGEGGVILDQDGEPIGQVEEGDPEDLVGKTVGDDGEILDEDGDVIGRVGVHPDRAQELADGAKGDVEDAAEDVEDAVPELPGLDVLKGLEVQENGDILDADGAVLGKITEGDPTDLVGQALNENGEVLDEDGDVIGRAEVVEGEGVDKLRQKAQEEEEAAQAAADEEAKAALPDVGVLKGLEVGEGGKILDSEGNELGQLVEGDAEELAGQKIDEEGNIINEEGEVVGRAEVVPGEAADKLAEEAAEEAGEAGALDGVDGVEMVDGVPEITPDMSILAGKKVNKKGNILDEEGEVIGKLTEDSDLSQCAGKTVNEKGEITNSKGEVVGKVEVVAGEAAEEAMKELHPEIMEAIEKAAEEATPDLSSLEGLKVNKNGDVLDEDGEVIGKLSSGELGDVRGKKINDKGEILDKDGNVIGKVELIPSEPEAAEEAAEAEGEEVPAEEAGPEMPPLSILEGLKVNKTGFIVDANGKPIGKLVEGDAKKLSRSGAVCDDQGQFWDGRGNVIGRAETLPKDDGEDDGEFAGLEGLIVVKDGFVEDENGNRVGILTEGDAKKLVGRHVDEDGDVIDKRGNVVGHAERYEEPEVEAEEEAAPVDLSFLKGKTVNKQGNVIGDKGVPVARLVEGNVKECAGRSVDENGQLWNDSGKTIGRVELIPENEQESKAEGPFAGLEGLVVVKGGMVEDEDGNTVGQVVEGDPKKLVGRAVDEDGDIIDKYGNVKGHAEPYDEPEEEVADLSILDGKTVNKAGNVVDEHGTVFGRVADGDLKSLIGKKVDGQGQIWSDSGKVIGHAELLPGGERPKADGPFSGFEGLVVVKDGLVHDGQGQVVGKLIDGDPVKLVGRKVDEDGEILDNSGNSLGKAERYTPEEKKRDINPMSGRKVNKEGEVRDADGNIIGRLTSGNLATLIGKEIDDNGFVVDNDGNKIGECTLLENIQEEEEPEQEYTEEELAEMKKKQEDAELAKKMTSILSQTLDRIEPVLKNITEAMDKADRTPKEELDEEELVQQVKPMLEEGGRILQECNGAIRGLDPDGRIAATAKARAASREATPEEYQLADHLKELTTRVVTTIDNAKKRVADMPHAKKGLSPLWGLLTEPLFQIIAAVGLLLAGVLGLVGRLLNGLGLGGLVNGLLGGLGIDKLLGGLGLGKITESLGLGGGKKKK
ncbi:hypothetical protein MMC25_004562 [Agyrium rufum]|nr:hypothetical protein [Agyrium rufum]